MSRVLVCGGRDFADREKLFEILDEIRTADGGGPWVLIHGAARGADSLAGEWARSRGVPEIAVPADWRTHGKAAGPIRNKAMLRDHRPDVVIAFAGGNGTAHMVRIAEAAGVPVLKFGVREPLEEVEK